VRQNEEGAHNFLKVPQSKFWCPGCSLQPKNYGAATDLVNSLYIPSEANDPVDDQREYKYSCYGQDACNYDCCYNACNNEITIIIFNNTIFICVCVSVNR